MDRRKYLKTLALGTVSTGVILESCSPVTKSGNEKVETPTYDRTKEELAYYNKIVSEKFFDEHEMKTITALVDIIIPRDETSGSASDAGVPDFIEFIAKDMPRHQVPLRGGLKWLDIQSLKASGAVFIDATAADRLKLIDAIAFPEQGEPGMEQGVAFFNLMRDLTATGFFTSEIGLKDLGYMGNKPNQWDGVPQEVLDQYGLKYDDRTMEISVKFES